MAHRQDPEPELGTEPELEPESEPTLPPHPAVSWNVRTRSVVKRKRSIASQLFSDSSDQPIFSSDDDPAADNYVQEHHKRRYIGPWFSQQPVSDSSDSSLHRRPSSKQARAKRTLERQVDSGVFMGSDSSFDDILNELAPPLASSRLPQLNQVPRASQGSWSSPAEAESRRRIERCIEQGDETVDLSGLHLERISNATISALSEFVRIPNVERGVPFENQDPELKLFLFSNKLTRVPAAIFNLEHLTVLSLRGNELTELPPSILQLKNLKELNVSQNSLRYLPMELLELMYDKRCRLTSLSVHPNPWHQPQVAESEAPWRAENRCVTEYGSRWLSNNNHSGVFHAKLWARTPVQFTNVTGTTHYTNFRIDSRDTQLPVENIEPSRPKAPGVPPSSSLPAGVLTTKVPPLMELILQSCSRSAYLAELPGYLDHDAPPQLCRLLADTHEQVETGGMKCTACKRPVIKPTAQWIEWWEMWRVKTADFSESHDQQSEEPPLLPLSISPDERLVPFIRRACSWNCMLDRVKGPGRRQDGN